MRERVAGHGGGGEATRLFGGRVASVAVRACCPRSRVASRWASPAFVQVTSRVSVQEGQAQFLLNTAKRLNRINEGFNVKGWLVFNK